MNKYLLYVGAVLLFGALSYYFAYFHEVTHMQIYKYAGCDSTMHFDLLRQYVTATTGDCENATRLSHDINEVVGYNVMPVLTMILVALIVIIVLEVESK